MLGSDGRDELVLPIIKLPGQKNETNYNHFLSKSSNTEQYTGIKILGCVSDEVPPCITGGTPLGGGRPCKYGGGGAYCCC